VWRVRPVPRCPSCRCRAGGRPEAARRAGLEGVEKLLTTTSLARTRWSGALACFAFRPIASLVDLGTGWSCASPWSWSPSPRAGSASVHGYRSHRAVPRSRGRDSAPSCPPRPFRFLMALFALPGPACELLKGRWHLPQRTHCPFNWLIRVLLAWHRDGQRGTGANSRVWELRVMCSRISARRWNQAKTRFCLGRA
jgi:hypothetical protein